jgi:integrase
VTLLRQHKERVRERVESVGATFGEDLFVFSGLSNVDHREPYSPNAVTQRYKDMAARLGIKTNLHAIRHYSATELQMSRIASGALFGKIRELLLPATSPFGLDQGRLVETSSHTS